jgi:hypothetical protein
MSGGMLTVSEVMARGWTRAMIENLLGPPDSFRDSGTRSTTMMYKLDRVIAAERTEAFVAARAMSKLRSAGMRAGS